MLKSVQGGKHESERQCAVTRARVASGKLLRFALDPEGHVVPDLKAKLPGRGVWTTCTREVVEKAIASRAFDRGFRRSVKVSGDLPGQIESLLERACLERLSLSNKAGLVVSGFDKVSKAVKSGKVEHIFHASDAAPDGCRKLDCLFKAKENGPETADLRPCCLNSEQLSLALGRPNVIHAALKKGVQSQKFLAAMARLEKFRAGNAVNAAA